MKAYLSKFKLLLFNSLGLLTVVLGLFLELNSSSFGHNSPQESKASKSYFSKKVNLPGAINLIEDFCEIEDTEDDDEDEKITRASRHSVSFSSFISPGYKTAFRPVTTLRKSSLKLFILYHSLRIPSLI